MRKVFFVLLTLLLFGGAVAFSTTTPANATPDRPYICHAEGMTNRGTWNKAFPVNVGQWHGHIGHQNGEDIIPPFEYEGQIVSQNWFEPFITIYYNDCIVPADPTATSTATATHTATATNTATATSTATDVPTATATATETATNTPTVAITVTGTPPNTPTETSTSTPTNTPTSTPTVSETPDVPTTTPTREVVTALPDTGAGSTSQPSNIIMFLVVGLLLATGGIGVALRVRS